MKKPNIIFSASSKTAGVRFDVEYRSGTHYVTQTEISTGRIRSTREFTRAKRKYALNQARICANNAERDAIARLA